MFSLWTMSSDWCRIVEIRWVYIQKISHDRTIARSHVYGYEPEIDWQALLRGVLCLMHVDHSFTSHITYMYALFIYSIFSRVSRFFYVFFFFCPFRAHMIFNDFKLKDDGNSILKSFIHLDLFIFSDKKTRS